MSDEEIKQFYEKMFQKMDLKDMLMDFVLEQEIKDMFPPFVAPPKPMPLAVIPIWTYHVHWKD